MKSIALFVFIFSLFTATVFTQSQNEKGLEYALTQLSQLNRKPAWKNQVFVDKFQRNISKAKNYLGKLKSEGADKMKVTMYENRIRSFKMILEMNTKSRSVPTNPQPRPAETPRADETDMQRKIRERNERLRREWQESQAAAWKSHKDNGTPNAVHSQNVGKIRFGNLQIRRQSDSFANSFAVEAPFSYHLFLPKSVQNLAVDQAKANNDRRWLATTSNKVLFVVSVDGKKMHQWVEVSPDSLIPNTYFSKPVMLKQPVDVYGRGDFYGFLRARGSLEVSKRRQTECKSRGLSLQYDDSRKQQSEDC